jgi:hypothetical protein
MRLRCPSEAPETTIYQTNSGKSTGQCDEIDSVLDAIGSIHGVGKTQSSLVLSVKFDRR